MAIIPAVLDAPGPQVSYAYVMALSDERGIVYVFDFVKNKYLARNFRFWSLARTGVSASCMQFNSVRRRELIVCLSDSNMHCYNIDSCQLVAKLPMCHHNPPRNLSIHPTRPLALSTSSSESVLWDTEKWERIRVLTGTNGAGMQQASFSPDGICIIAAFTDGNIFFWTIESFSLLWKINLTLLANPSTESMQELSDTLQATRINHFCISSSGEYFAYGGISSKIHVWNLFEKRLVHEILIPLFNGTFIIQVNFLGTTNVLYRSSDL